MAPPPLKLPVPWHLQLDRLVAWDEWAAEWSAVVSARRALQRLAEARRCEPLTDMGSVAIAACPGFEEGYAVVEFQLTGPVSLKALAGEGWAALNERLTNEFIEHILPSDSDGIQRVARLIGGVSVGKEAPVLPEFPAPPDAVPPGMEWTETSAGRSEEADLHRATLALLALQRVLETPAPGWGIACRPALRDHEHVEKRSWYAVSLDNSSSLPIDESPLAARLNAPLARLEACLARGSYSVAARVGQALGLLDDAAVILPLAQTEPHPRLLAAMAPADRHAWRAAALDRAWPAQAPSRGPRL